MLRIKALGCLTVTRSDEPIVGAAAQPKRVALLALLARAGDRGITRDKVLGYFWPDTEEERARRSLANMIWALRRELAADELFLPGNDLRLNPDVISNDVEEFEAAMSAGDFERAAALYEGPFLDGFRLAGAPEFDRWIDAERAALAHKFAAAAEKLARSAEARADWDAAVAWWRKVAALDPLNARLTLGLMRALAAAGDPAGALRQARIYETLVEQELDLPPDREVVTLAKQLRDAQPGSASQVDSGRGSAAPTGAAATGRFGHDAGPQVVNDANGVEPAAAEETARPTTPASSPVAALPASAVKTEASAPVEREPSPARDHASRDTPTSAMTAPQRRRRSIARWAVAAAVLGGVGFLVSRVRIDGAPQRSSPVVVALGQIADHRTDRSTELVKPLTDMLATALARSTAVRVVSTARMYELARGAATSANTASPDRYVSAARGAGATELIDGALYAIDDSTLRLDLRRIDLATGNVRGAHSVTAHGPFALADSGTARLLADLGAAAPAGSVADVTTASLTAYRFYDEGLRAFYLDDIAAAERLFAAALKEDTAFASAAYYLSLTVRQDDARNSMPLLERAVRLAARAGERERLTIQASWALATSSPLLRPTAESLLVRYPHEVDGYLFTGIVCVADGMFMDAVPYLERAITMDSLSLRGARSRCSACEAFRWLTSAYQLADSGAAAERVVRRWLTLQPRSGMVYASLVDVLMNSGRADDAVAAWRQRSALAAGRENDATVITRIKLKAGAFDEADQLMRSAMLTSSPMGRAEAVWYLALTDRYQGRLVAALQHAREEQRLTTQARPDAAPPAGGIAEAQVLFEMGRAREAAAMFDGIARWTPAVLPSPGDVPGAVGRHRAWHFTHAANALAAIGDTAGFEARADTVQRHGAHSAYRLHRELHHHVRGLLLAARGRDDEAIDEFRQAIYSPTSGYTRTSYELARALLRRGRPAEAISYLQPALRGGVEASNFYITGTELHELLAQAWDSLGSAAARGRPVPLRVSPVLAADSAAAHYRWVARAWRGGDPSFAARAARALARAQELGR